MADRRDGVFEKCDAPSFSSSTGLVQGLRLNDPVAWSKFVQMYGAWLYARCRRAGLDREYAADVLQEVFLRVVQSLGRFEHDPRRGTFRGWLWTITLNQIREHFRGKGGEPNARAWGDWIETLPDELGELDNTEELTDLGRMVQLAVQTIRDEFESGTWRAFWLVAVDGLAPAEVAEICGLSVGAVRQAKYRVLRRLRQELGDITF